MKTFSIRWRRNDRVNVVYDFNVCVTDNLLEGRDFAVENKDNGLGISKRSGVVVYKPLTTEAEKIMLGIVDKHFRHAGIVIGRG